MSETFGFPVGSNVMVDARNYVPGPAVVLEIQKRHLIVWMTERGCKQKVPKRRCAKLSFVGWLYFTDDGQLRVSQTWGARPPYRRRCLTR